MLFLLNLHSNSLYFILYSLFNLNIYETNQIIPVTKRHTLQNDKFSVRIILHALANSQDYHMERSLVFIPSVCMKWTRYEILTCIKDTVHICFSIPCICNCTLELFVVWVHASRSHCLLISWPVCHGDQLIDNLNDNTKL